jgi:hypothetical protein
MSIVVLSAKSSGRLAETVQIYGAPQGPADRESRFHADRYIKRRFEAGGAYRISEATFRLRTNETLSLMALFRIGGLSSHFFLLDEATVIALSVLRQFGLMMIEPDR